MYDCSYGTILCLLWSHVFREIYHEIFSTAIQTPSAGLRRAVVSYWRMYMHLTLVKRSGGLSLPSDMTVIGRLGRKTTTQTNMLTAKIWFSPILCADRSEPSVGRT